MTKYLTQNGSGTIVVLSLEEYVSLVDNVEIKRCVKNTGENLYYSALLCFLINSRTRGNLFTYIKIRAVRHMDNKTCPAA